MDQWKKILLRAAGFGGGFAVVVAIILGVVVWWSGRPVKPKPWNKTAITATFNNLRTEGDKHTIVYEYTLQNNTDTDYQLSDETDTHLGFKRMQTDSMDFSDKTFVKADYPIYVPAKSRVNLELHMPLPYDSDVDTNAPDDVQHDYYTKLSHFVATTISNVSGFVLMDDTARYEIDLPNGWTAIGNRPLRVKSPNTAK